MPAPTNETNTKYKFPIPTVHLNGTGRESLLKQYTDVMHQVANLRIAFGNAWPHGRDYYMQDDGAYELARAAAEAIRADLDQIEKTYEQLALAVYRP